VPESHKTGTMGLASSSSCGRPQPSREWRKVN